MNKSIILVGLMMLYLLTIVHGASEADKQRCCYAYGGFYDSNGMCRDLPHENTIDYQECINNSDTNCCAPSILLSLILIGGLYIGGKI